MSEATKVRVRITKNDLKENLLGQVLADLRVTENISQQEVAEKIKVSQSFISRVESPAGIALKTMVNYLDAIGYNLIIEKK